MIIRLIIKITLHSYLRAGTILAGMERRKKVIKQMPPLGAKLMEGKKNGMLEQA